MGTGRCCRQQAGRENAVEQHEWEIKWTGFLTVGVPQMDEEHKKFIAQVNELTKAVLECRDKATIRRLMDSMLAEAANHFRNEEKLLAEWNYPERAVHAAKHVQLTAQLDLVKREFETPAISFMGALKGLQINQLLIDHLLKEDMKYRDFLRARTGLSTAAHERAVRGTRKRLQRRRVPGREGAPVRTNRARPSGMGRPESQ